MILRKTTISDAKLLFEWSNDSVTRKNSFSDKPIVWEEHLQWLTKKLNNNTCFFYIAEDNGMSVGTIRMDADEALKEVIISYSVAPTSRGKGYGTLILEKASEVLPRTFSGYTLIGKVKTDNLPSRKCFEKSGFIAGETVEENGVEEVVFSKKL